MTGKNADLVALQHTLGQVVDDLVKQQEAATDPAVIKALAVEIREVLFRVTGVQQALFKAQTAAITAAVARVDQAKADLDEAIAAIESVNSFIKSVSAFLGLVDKVIDLAKLV